MHVTLFVFVLLPCCLSSLLFEGARDEGAWAYRVGQQGDSAAHGQDELHDGEGGPVGGSRGTRVPVDKYHFLLGKN